MGADVKRKQARKRKFGSQNSESQPGAGVKLDLEGISTDEPPTKKSKKAPFSPSSSEDIPTDEKIAAPKTAVVDEPTDKRTEENSATHKPQRFIVFIGPFTLTIQIRLGQPSDGLLLRQVIYLTVQQMSQ